MRSFPRSIPLAIVSVALLAQQPPAANPAAPPAAPSAEAKVREDGLYATLHTTMGALTIRLFEKEAPLTVQNFVGLARGGKAWTDPKTKRRTTRPMYPGTIFHRVIPEFMIQGGDPTGTGDGGTDIVKDEIVPTLKYDVPGRVGVANAGPGTGSCQFFVTEIPTPHLDGKHPIFGQVVENLELVGKIARVPRDASNRPNQPVKIEKITFERWAGGALVPEKAAAAKKVPAKKTAPAKKPAPAKK